MFNKRDLRPVPMNFSMQDGMIDIDNNAGNIDIDFAQAANQVNQVNMPMAQGLVTQPVVEPMQERVVQRTIMHEVPQDWQFMIDFIRDNKYKIETEEINYFSDLFFVFFSRVGNYFFSGYFPMHYF